MNIDTYYKNLGKSLSKVGHLRFDPNNEKDQASDLLHIIQKYNCKNILEIGFNAGHSADFFLSINDNIKLTSFDIGEMESVLYGKSFIDTKYPFRHNLIIGDSKKTVPQYFQNYPRTKFDLVFIDGAHEFMDSLTDLVNCKNLSHKNTIVVMDDTRYSEPFKSWTVGPSECWQNCLDKKYIKELGRSDYNYKDFPWKGQSWGLYENF